MIDESDVKPIFIFSLPRSGSTLLQRILATSEDISTASEPWVLLPFLYALKEKGIYAEYSHFSVYSGLQDLCKEMPNGEDDYLAAVRTAMLHVYGGISSDSSRYFLDKTPRYALVANEVFKVFSEAKMIFLWRNPLAIIASIVETFCQGKWKLFHYKVDLFDGMENLIQVYDKKRSKCMFIRYEDLIIDPKISLRKIEIYLGLEEGGLQMDDFSSINLNGRKGDPTGVKKYSTISSRSLDRWKDTISNPWRKYLCQRYLKWLGEKRLSLMGYDLDDLISELNEVPNRWGSIVSDILYSIYGVFYCVFEFKILKDKMRSILKLKLIKKHD